MPSNVEIKARIENPEQLPQLLQSITETPETLLQQYDTFFPTPTGRLKLRRFTENRPAELIYYERPDQVGPRQSEYKRLPIDNADYLTEILGATLGIRGEVIKTRRLFLVGQTRIHLDDVKNLGAFLELEVVLRESQSAKEGVTIAEKILQRLHIASDSLVSSAYIDLLEEIPGLRSD